MTDENSEIRRLERFVYSEVRCIDERRWDDWLGLFAEDGDYWIPLTELDTEPRTSLSILYEDRPKLELRCQRYSHPQLHAQNPPSKTAHLVSNVMQESADRQGIDYQVSAQFLMREHRLGRSIDWVGTLRYSLRDERDSLAIVRKTVILVNLDSELETIQMPI